MDKERFEEVWGMHEEELKQTIDRVFMAEKTLYNQQLGIEWIAPEDVI